MLGLVSKEPSLDGGKGGRLVRRGKRRKLDWNEVELMCGQWTD